MGNQQARSSLSSLLVALQIFLRPQPFSPLESGRERELMAVACYGRKIRSSHPRQVTCMTSSGGRDLSLSLCCNWPLPGFHSKLSSPFRYIVILSREKNPTLIFKIGCVAPVRGKM